MVAGFCPACWTNQVWWNETLRRMQCQGCGWISDPAAIKLQKRTLRRKRKREPSDGVRDVSGHCEGRED